MLDTKPAILDRSMRTLRAISNNIQAFGTKSEKHAFVQAMKVFNRTPKRSLGSKSPNDIVHQGFLLSPWQFLSDHKIKYFNYEKNKKDIDRKMVLAKKQMKTLTPVRISRTKIKAIRKKNTFKKRSLLAGWTKEVYFIFAHKSKFAL